MKITRSGASMTCAPILAAACAAILAAACAAPEPTMDLARAPATSCDSLAGLGLADTTITRAEVVPAGAFVSDQTPAFYDPPADYSVLPAFCRVGATVSPVPDSEIRLEVWMPEEGWNGRFVGLGDGANMGQIHHWDMAPILAAGYAVANSNTGHDGGPVDGSFFARRESLVDFAERAEHEMTVKAKDVIAAYYGAPARHAYWTGCSTGGRQGLAEVQRHPEDYDGVAAFAAVSNYVLLHVWALQAEQVFRGEDTASLMGKLTLLRDAAIAACDAADGVIDQVVDDPRTCGFDPGVLACGGGESADCLTPAELVAVRELYRGPVNPRTGERIYWGALPTGEPMWGFYAPDVIPFATAYYSNAVFGDDWTVFDFDFDADVARVVEADGGLMAPRDPDISAFTDRGGKLLMLHGWADGAVSPFDTISYYQSVMETMGPRADDDVRLFMLPGVEHCGGGLGPDQVDPLEVLTAWVEEGRAPERVIASKALDDGSVRTRPLCPYPQVARYDGEGDTDEADSFTCVAPADAPM